MRYLAALFFASILPAAAQTPEVPHKMSFAGMTLTIRDDARREIQKDVDALTQSPRHYDIKAERARTYFPIIEKIFKEERLPEDFKYLVLQESALIPDAVSSSNAVGFWQFKDFTAVEMGMRVDRQIDERMNIVSSTRAAARYLKKNNYYFNNWLYALQAYQMGAGAVMQRVKDTEGGANHMEITSNTYWYVKKFLAHKVAFEDVLKAPAQLQLTLYDNKEQKTLKRLAGEMAVDEASLLSYNKWIKSGTIPSDKVYTVVCPVPGSQTELSPALASARNNAPVADIRTGESNAMDKKDERTKINGVAAVKARPGETSIALADRAGVDLSHFLKCNDITISDKLVPGQFYFVSKKRMRSEDAYHKVVAGENLWSISQRYGVRMKRLKRYNDLKSEADVHPGMTLWLSSNRPKDQDGGKDISPKEVIEIDRQETFSWTADPAKQPVAVPSITPPVVSVTTAAGEEEANHTNEVEQSQVPVSNAGTDSVKVNDKPVTVTVPVSQVETTIIRPEKYVVQPGETLYAIARKYDVAVMDLAGWNNLKIQEGIRPGQVLKLGGTLPQAVEEEKPVADTVIKSDEIIHEVKPSETLYSVARKYGVTIKEVMDWNGKKDFSVSVGEKLKIHQK